MVTSTNYTQKANDSDANNKTYDNFFRPNNRHNQDDHHNEILMKCILQTYIATQSENMALMFSAIRKRLVVL